MTMTSPITRTGCYPQKLSKFSLRANKSHPSKAPKSEPFLHATSSSQGSATPLHTETAPPIPSEMQTTSTSSATPSSQDDRLSTVIESVSQWISRLDRLIYSTNNQVQMCLTTIETQLDAIQQKLEESL